MKIYLILMKSLARILKLLIAFLIFSTACQKENTEPEILTTSIVDSFESGSIGTVNKISNTEWELFIEDDNSNHSLPDSWRSWWYVRVDNMPDSVMKFTIKNSGWPFYYIPVYSYDQKEWLRLNEEEVTQNSKNELIIEKKFSRSKVWLAMFYPYTLKDLGEFLSSVEGNPNIEISKSGSSRLANPIYLLKMTDFSVPVMNKKRVLIHARTHPAETPPSFLIEGFVKFLLSGNGEANNMLKEYEFHIFPMQNVDGVVSGNYRSTPQSENLEMLWTYNTTDPINLTDNAPEEVDIIHKQAKSLMTDGGPKVSIALNLHASNSEPDVRPFFFPHFGPEELGYSAKEASLWNNQLDFISAFASNYGYDMIEPIPLEGGSSFASKTYPESWWWVNFQDSVMAITMEMTYGRSGYYPRWIDPTDMRKMGESFALGIRDYFELPANRIFLRQKLVNLKYPELYAPNAPDEMKE